MTQPNRPSVTQFDYATGNPVTITWDHEFRGQPSPYSAVYITRKDPCGDCAEPTWHDIDVAPLCQPCTRLRAYAALPWWRRWTSRKPRA